MMMSRALRKIFSVINFFVPYGIYNGYSNTINKMRVPVELTKKVTENKKFKDIHASSRCFILASGPSIRDQDLGFLKGEICFAVNEFYLHKDINLISPKYHIIAPNHAPFTKETNKTRFECLKRYYSDKVIVFLGDNNYQYSYWNFLNENTSYNKTNYQIINYYNYYQLDERNFTNNKTWDISRTPFAPRTVIYIGLQIAHYMGFKEIYLLGCDHDYLMDIKRITNHHFYEESQGISDVEHLRQFTSEKWFEEYYFRWKQYRLMKEYLNHKGVFIYNATRGGMLDVFPRVVYEDLFRK